MADELAELMRVREQIASLILEGKLSQDTCKAMKDVLASLDADIAAARARHLDAPDQLSTST